MKIIRTIINGEKNPLIMKVRYMVLIKIKSTAVSKLAPNFELAPSLRDIYPSARSEPIEKRNNAYTANVIS